MAVCPTSSRRRPLVVAAEDDTPSRIMLGRLLELNGFEVLLAADGREAIRAAMEGRPDAIVSDLRMPGFDGLGVCRAMRALYEGRPLPIVIWSSVDSDDPRLREALLLDGVHFLSKGVAVNTITALVWRLIATGPSREGVRADEQ